MMDDDGESPLVMMMVKDNDDDAGDAFLLQKCVTKIASDRNQLKSFQFTRESDRIPVTGVSHRIGI